MHGAADKKSRENLRNKGLSAAFNVVPYPVSSYPRTRFQGNPEYIRGKEDYIGSAYATANFLAL